MPNYQINGRFSPVVAAIVASSVVFNLSQPAVSETTEFLLEPGEEIAEPEELDFQLLQTLKFSQVDQAVFSSPLLLNSVEVTEDTLEWTQSFGDRPEDPPQAIWSSETLANAAPQTSREPLAQRNQPPDPVDPDPPQFPPSPQEQPDIQVPIDPDPSSEPPEVPADPELPQELPEPNIPTIPQTPTQDPEVPAPTQEPAQPPATQEPAPEPRVLVGEVDVVGAEGELEDLVYNTITTQPGRITTRSQLQEDINAVYATGFFANVRVVPEDTPVGVRVAFIVEPNPVLSNVEVQTIPAAADARVLPPEVVDEIFGEQYGEILNLQQLQEDIRDLNEWYTENGYELAQVVGAPEIADDGIVTLQVAEGVIEDIEVRYFDEEDEPTDGKTREFIITREIELEGGDVFKSNIAQDDLQRVFGLGLFEDVRLSFEPGEDPRTVDLVVEVVEGSTGSLGAGAGISSASGLFGTVSYQQRNLGGNNQTLSAEFQLGTRELLFETSFTDPWIAGDPYRTSYTVNAFRRRSISLVYDGDDEDIRTADEDDRPRISRTGGGIQFFRPLAADPFERADWRLSAGFQYQRVAVRDGEGDIAPEARDEDGGINLAFSDDGTDDLFIFQVGAIRDLRNDILQPTSGSYLRFGVEQSVPIGSGSIFLTRIRGNYSYYIPVSFINFSEGPQTLAFNVQAGTVLGDLPPYEAFVIGGSNSVRGYSEGSLGSGRSYVQATAEYRFPIFSVVGGALFADFGTTLGTGDDVPGDPSEIRGLPGSGFGYGVGVRVNSPLGPIRIDYAINDEGDTELEFGIGQKF